MRVAHFVQRYPPALGGSEVFFSRLSRFLVTKGHAVSVFTTNALDLQALWKANGRQLPAGNSAEAGVDIRRYAIAHWPGRRYLLKALSFVPQPMWQCLTLPSNPICRQMWSAAGDRRDRFDIVHAAAFPYAWPIVCGLRMARRQRIPLVITPFLHLGNPDDPRDPTRRHYLSRPFVWLLRQAAVVVVQTELEKKAASQVVAEEKLIVLGMGVAAEECTGGDRQNVRRQWNVGDKEVVIGHLANNSQEKGTVDLLCAAEKAWRNGARFRLILAGPEMPNFRKFYRSYSAADQVQRLGVLTEREKRDFFAGIDIFALPSRSDSFGLVLLEAWANHVPNIAYRAGGIAEVIRNEVDGLLVSCGDVSALADAITKVSRDPELRRRLGRAGHERIPVDFRWEDKLTRMHELYKELIKR